MKILILIALFALSSCGTLSPKQDMGEPGARTTMQELIESSRFDGHDRKKLISALDDVLVVADKWAGYSHTDGKVLKTSLGLDILTDKSIVRDAYKQAEDIAAPNWQDLSKVDQDELKLLHSYITLVENAIWYLVSKGQLDNAANALVTYTRLVKDVSTYWPA